MASKSRSISWRKIIIGVVAVLIVAGAGLYASGIPALALRGYLYGLPAYEVARSRAVGLSKGEALNVFAHKRELADHETRLITTPNNDTLYSSAFVDLSRGPVTIAVPGFGGRYYSLAFIDAYTNNSAIVGQRTIGGGPAKLRVVGPDWKGEAAAGETLVRVATPQVWLLARILIDGPRELDSVHALQDALVIKGPSESAFPPDAVPAEPNGPDFVRVVNQVLRDNPPPVADQPELAALRRVGLGPDAGPLSWWQNLAWRVGFPVARYALVKGTEGRLNIVEGWSYTRPGIGDYGVDYPYRAAVALRGLLALPEVEAIYSRPAEDQKGRPLEPGKRYRLRLPPGAPPVNAFWSLSAYEVEPDGGLYFADNAIHRYAIGDRTQGLVRNAEGGLDILVQSERPTGAEAANWLPVPAKPFALITRAYLPKEELLSHNWRYPTIERLDD